ncbi:uncharacterized protein MYCFIDRAFT_201256 [Pseudocercospora fijiensis CIRAD86]|uniref:Phosphatidate phosphatase APP1 catalytic domain-containing protein n=1 Tax=Pseudocercospora fijiensis (strain CIRAD86) TaxID=383855 RepID=N1Q698_PSEFD|nr:uncharacterized protein MYCFIDRAFT_201256 [Pseudocercospora fijiensis CIRAD86]EME87764.1 hypothetical protein MYCFIDRAFT_201256 [Pseudocercospora fijiensis CIRAD86]
MPVTFQLVGTSNLNASSMIPHAYAEGREPGARRKKFAGYLKAANDLRQTYFSQDGARESHHAEDGSGAFPDAAVVRSGNEEMILFPSYARRHVKSKRPAAATPGREVTEEEYWRREWDKHEDINAIVDVDVRGWIYTPPKGAHTRKQRMLIGLARQLSGIPAPPPNRPGESDPSSVVPSRSSSPTRQQDEDLINLEAENIVRRGEQEEHSDAGATVDPVRKRSSWQPREKMTSSELATANMHLLARLKPFMANPLANTPISAFFYNESASRQQTVYTDASGHFTLRAALDFVPTHVRVLAGEKLSATEEVIVTSPHGVSLISDIDDTIKHSAISAGVREIFRNAFIRELGDLTIEGVREWYTTLHDMGVKIHYVSNSPWQMYPALTSFFKLANLPKGSFHLKQYSGGMLQGIFEPVAERKRSSLDKIMRDFPDRKFVLVGDSGEADLEVYTETALANPGRVLGIFIRDVTTSPKTGYFDSNTSPGGSGQHSRNHSRHQSGDSLGMSKRLSRPADLDDDAEMRAAIAASLEDMEKEAQRARKSINPDAYQLETTLYGERTSSLPNKPRSPQRLDPHSHSQQSFSGRDITASPEEDLIDFSDPAPSKPWLEPSRRRHSPSNKSLNGATLGQRPSPSPPPPPKPAGLRSPPPDAQASSESQHKTPPPRPRKPSIRKQANRLSGGFDDEGAPGTPGDGISKKEYMWQQRWAKAKSVLERNGVTLRSWRTGSDVADVCVRLVEMELRKIERESRSQRDDGR